MLGQVCFEFVHTFKQRLTKHDVGVMENVGSWLFSTCAYIDGIVNPTRQIFQRFDANGWVSVEIQSRLFICSRAKD